MNAKPLALSTNQLYFFPTKKYLEVVLMTKRNFNFLFSYFFNKTVKIMRKFSALITKYFPRAKARVTNSALAFTYIRIMRCYIAQWHSGIKSRPIRHFLCHGRW